MATDFFENQDAARRRTWWLIAGFVAAVATIVALTYLVVALVFYNWLNFDPYSTEPARLWNLELFIAVALGVLLVVLFGSLYKTYELSRGGETVALMLGGRRIEPATTDVAERRLLNVVEEMAIASGTPVPPVYLLDHEPGINAFAAGFDSGDAVIGVTRGALDYLNRDELQGVMAHEFSHILNGDMRLNLRLIGLIHGILILAIIGWYVLRSGVVSGRSRGRRDGGGPILVVGIALLVIGYLGVFLGKIIKACVSRQREYLADAAAVQFTRNPDGIAGALKKIGGLVQKSHIDDAHAEETSHMFFGDAMVGSFVNIFATHPPLEKRIRQIDPTFDGRFPRPQRIAAPTRREQPRQAGLGTGRPDRRILPIPGMPTIPGIPALAAGAATANRRAVITGAEQARQLIGNIAAIDADQIAYAAAVMDALPEALDEAARDPYGARAIIYALLLDDDAPLRQRQLAQLQAHAQPESFRQTVHLLQLIDQMNDDALFPLVELTFPALRELSPQQYQQFRANVEMLVAADQRISEREFVLRTMIIRHLDVHFGLAKPPKIRRYSVRSLGDEMSVLLSTLARAGHTDPADVEEAFAAAATELGMNLSLLPRDHCTLAAFDAALKTSAKGSPGVKRRVLQACAVCVMADGQATPRERDLLRAVADSLGCPMPPLFFEPA